MPTLTYNVEAVGLGQLRRVVRGVESELVASNKRVMRKTEADRARRPATTAVNRAEERAQKERERQIRKNTQLQLREIRKQITARDRLEAQAERKRLRAIEREGAARKRMLDRSARWARQNIERERRAAASARVSMARGVARGTAGTLRGAGRMAAGTVGLLGTFAAGNAVRERIGAQETALGIANRAAVVEGETRSREQIQGGVFGQTEKLSRDTGRSQENFLDFLDRFAIKTGDINAAQKLLPQLAALGDAMGMTEEGFSQLGEASGIMFAGLVSGGMAAEDAAKETLKLAKVQAAQSAVGQIGTDDLARLAPVFLAAASRFQGDAGKNLATVSGLANISVATASASPEEAATAVSRFTDDLINQEKKLKNKFGINVKDKSGRIKGFDELLPQLIEKSGGSVFGLKKMGFGVRGLRAIEPLVNLFREKGGGKEGQAAVDALIKKFTGVTLTDEQVTAGSAATRGGEARQIQKAFKELNIAIATELTPVLINDLVPAVRDLAPMVGDAARGFVGLVDFFRQNPFTGVAAILGASIAKEVATARIGAAIEKGIGKSMGSGGGKGKGAMLGGAVGLTLAAAAVTIMATEVAISANTVGQKEGVEKSISLSNAMTSAQLEVQRTGKLSDKTKQSLQAKIDETNAFTGFSDEAAGQGLFKSLWNSITGGGPGVGDSLKAFGQTEGITQTKQEAIDAEKFLLHQKMLEMEEKRQAAMQKSLDLLDASTVKFAAAADALPKGKQGPINNRPAT